MLTMGSLCDGMGGWCLAAIRHGVRPVWSSEIDKNCLLIEKRHFPNVVQLGDMNLIKELPPVDIVCAGTPCQDLSLAGKREGLDGKRSSLFFRATELVSDMLNRTRGKYPSFLCWENVPGSFSSNRGRDFKRVLEEITQAEIPIPPSGRWAESGMVRSRRCDVSWRCLDAQYWGVPQRRNRIFLVADFRQGGRCPEVLFIEPSLPRDSEPSGEAGQTSTGSSESGTDETSYAARMRYGRIGEGGRTTRPNESERNPLNLK